MAIIWLCLTYWVGLGLDYLPVLVGATEMPVAARAVLLTAIAAVLGFILYRFILRRAFVRLADRNMAILLERRFEDFHDSLVTSVEMIDQPEHAAPFDETMLRHTSQQANIGLRSVRLARIFDFRPLILSLLTAVLLLVTIGGFLAAKPGAFKTSIQRLYLLRSTPWPRKARIEVVGILTDQSILPADAGSPLPIVPFDNGVVKVARGSSVELIVRADASKAVSVVPDYCYLHYQTDEGERGLARMIQLGRRENQVQRYTYRNKPLEKIMSSINFDVVGYDHRVSGFRLQTVDNPAVVKTTLDCIYPEYTDLDRDKDLPFTRGMQLPRGTSITIHCTSNKPLNFVHVLDNSTHKAHLMDLASSDSSRGEGPREFTHRTASLNENLSLEFTLQDTDNVIGQRTHQVFITSTPDTTPSVDVRTGGVGSVVTPDVIMPFAGRIVDDFGVERTWFRVEHIVGQESPVAHELDFQLGTTDRATPSSAGTAGQGDGNDDRIDPTEFRSSIDFKEERGTKEGIKLAPRDRIVVSVRAMDNCGLAEGPNEGSGDRVHFDVVTSDELLAILEAREIGLRRRFEQAINELTAARDSLLHISDDLNDADAKVEPGDREPADNKRSPEEIQEQPRSLHPTRVQQASSQSKKISREVLGIAESFSAIRLELINNRIDTNDRKQRLDEKIAQPLRDIVETMFPALDARLQHLEKVLKDEQKNKEATDLAIAQANDVLAELNRVLQDMLDIETYNELMNIVRALIDDQKELSEKAGQQRRKGLLDE